jgi:hypothetical protein
MANCPTCGASVKSNLAYCHACGDKLLATQNVTEEEQQRAMSSSAQGSFVWLAVVLVAFMFLMVPLLGISALFGGGRRGSGLFDLPTEALALSVAIPLALLISFALWRLKHRKPMN